MVLRMPNVAGFIRTVTDVTRSVNSRYQFVEQVSYMWPLTDV